MKKYIILFLICYHLNAYSSPQVQSGQNVGPNKYESSHILESSDVYYRSVDVHVTFEKEFYTTPQVALAPSKIEMEPNFPIGFTIQLKDVSKYGRNNIFIKIYQGFTAQVTALTKRKVDICQFNWFSTDDPRIKVEYLKLENLDNEKTLDYNTGPRTLKITVPSNLDEKYQDDEINIAVFPVGLEISAVENAIIKTYAESVVNGAAKIMLATSAKSFVSSVELCVIFGNKQNFYASPFIGEQLPSTHDWNTKTGDRYIKQEVELPKELKTGKKAGLLGITGFNTNIEKTKMRFQLDDLKIEDKKVQFEQEIWGDSKATLLMSQFFVYVEDDYKVFSKECAELFTECNFKGELILLCDDIKNLKEHSKKPIRSVHVPKGKAVKLFDRTDLKGDEVIFTNNQECMENIHFGK